MKRYRIQVFRETGKLAREYDFTGPDDLSALDEALKHCTDNRVAVWEGERLVAQLEKGCDAA